MSVFSHLLAIDPSSLMGRDPSSLMMEVLDDSSQDGLRNEVDVLSALVASHAIVLPIGDARRLTMEMTPLLCSMARSDQEIDAALRHVHDWIVGLGDLYAVTRRVDAATRAARDVHERRGNIDLATLTTISQDDCDAIHRYQTLQEETSSERPMGGWTMHLMVADFQTLALMMRIGASRVVIGIGIIDQDDGRSRAAPKVPLLAA